MGFAKETLRLKTKKHILLPLSKYCSEHRFRLSEKVGSLALAALK